MSSPRSWTWRQKRAASHRPQITSPPPCLPAVAYRCRIIKELHLPTEIRAILRTPSSIHSHSLPVLLARHWLVKTLRYRLSRVLPSRRSTTASTFTSRVYPTRTRWFSTEMIFRSSPESHGKATTPTTITFTRASVIHRA